MYVVDTLSLETLVWDMERRGAGSGATWHWHWRRRLQLIPYVVCGGTGPAGSLHHLMPPGVLQNLVLLCCIALSIILAA